MPKSLKRIRNEIKDVEDKFDFWFALVLKKGKEETLFCPCVWVTVISVRMDIKFMVKVKWKRQCRTYRGMSKLMNGKRVAVRRNIQKIIERCWRYIVMELS